MQPVAILKGKIRETSKKRAAVAVLVFLVVPGLLVWHGQGRQPRAWKAEEVRVAFWAWQNEVPDQEDVRRAVRDAQADSVFLRAGQIDYEAGKLTRIRAVRGRLPGDIDLHLVYNATRSLLGSLEIVKAESLATAISEAYGEDAVRALRDGARIVGVQLDIDAPNRLLPYYAGILRWVRDKLPQGVKLSITGLPAWMDSPALPEVLTGVDFWVPQCYGAIIPERIDKIVPISSSQLVSKAMDRASRLRKPFYAGLAAYGYAIHYSRNGSLLALRGDLDPALVAADKSFEMVERRPFDGAAPRAAHQLLDTYATPLECEWRYVYQARRDVVLDGLSVRAGEYIMLDMPSASALRASIRKVRERAGEHLLGICFFRLPAKRDATNLSLEEVAAALRDSEFTFAADLQAEVLAEPVDKEAGGSGVRRLVNLRLTNCGTISSLLGDALTLEMRLPAGAVGQVSAKGFASSDFLCAGPSNADAPFVARSCGVKRANLIRLSAPNLPASGSLEARFEIEGAMPGSIPVTVTFTGSDGRSWRQQRLVLLQERTVQ